MGSFYAELHVAGHAFPVRRADFAVHQDTDHRGRVVGKVRHGPLYVTMDVPREVAVLEDWAAAPYKPLPGQLVFYDATAQIPQETISFAAGHCTHYGEEFDAGRTGGSAAYVCHLTITGEVFELLAGGVSARAFPAAVAAVAAVVTNGRVGETPTPGLTSTPGTPTGFVRSTAAVALSPALANILASTLLIAPSAGPGGPIDFEAAVKADLQALHNTPTGRKLLDSLHASGKRIHINYGKDNAAAFPYNPQPAFLQADGVTPGQGIALLVEYNPFIEETGTNAWNKRPPGIGLAHELIHAEQAAYGRMRRGKTPNPGGPDPGNPSKPLETYAFELETIGVPPHDSYPLTENKIRAEWNPPQTRRAHY